jgi:hypothetical protein
VPSVKLHRCPFTFVMSGQKMLPVIEFEDGSAYRAESKDMAETINAGKLFEQQRSAEASAAT